jgi:hypothetical protein
VKVPQGSKRNELIAIARKHRAQLTGDNVSYSAKSAANKASASGASAYGAATSSAGNQWAKATDDAQLKAEDLFNSAIGTWSDVSTAEPAFDSCTNFCSPASKHISMLAAFPFHNLARRTSFSPLSDCIDTRLLLAGLPGHSTHGPLTT